MKIEQDRAEILGGVASWDDPRDTEPWAAAAAAVMRSAEGVPEPGLRRRLLALAGDFFEGPRYRVRRIPQARLLEGWLSRRLAS